MTAYKHFIYLSFIVITSCGVSNEDLTEITSSRFGAMVQKSEIQKLVLVENIMYLEISLTPEAYQKVYRQELDRNPHGKNISGPHYKMEIRSIDKFLNEYEQFSKNVPSGKRIDIHFEERSDLKTVISNWILLLTFLLIIFFIIFIIRILIRANRKTQEDQERKLQNSSQFNVNVADQLERLAKLKDRGVLTEEEFALQKKKLLGQ